MVLRHIIDGFDVIVSYSLSEAWTYEIMYNIMLIFVLSDYIFLLVIFPSHGWFFLMFYLLSMRFASYFVFHKYTYIVLVNVTETLTMLTLF